MKTKQRGETHTNAKLTKTKVKQMREMRRLQKTYQAIGDKFHVSATTACRVCTHQVWK